MCLQLAETQRALEAQREETSEVEGRAGQLQALVQEEKAQVRACVRVWLCACARACTCASRLASKPAGQPQAEAHT